MSITIKSPIEGYSETTYLGSIPLKFEKGEVKVDELTDGQRAYLLSAGYDVGGTTVDASLSVDGGPVPDASSVDSRDLADPEQVGTALRDAAVDPEPSDFLAPVNAGKADPHGPEVVSPEIHASQGVRPIKGGDVHVDDVAVQDKLETEHAADATDGTPVVGAEPPAGNASKADWAAFAGLPEDTELTRDEIRAQYGPKA